jgi:predicted nucleic acid-binding protein
LIVADTSGLLSAFDESQLQHAAARAFLDAERGPIVLSPFVLAELDYLTTRDAGVVAELALLDELSSGGYLLASFDVQDLMSARRVIARYRDLRIGLTEASLVVLADRYRTNRIFTLDERHFRALEPLAGGTFELLPADA